MIVTFYIEIPLLGNPFQALNISRDGIEVLFPSSWTVEKELKFQIETLEVESQVDLPPKKRKHLIFSGLEKLCSTF